MYFKAVLLLSTEQLWLNPKTKTYGGFDPDTYQDCGVIETMTATSLKDLKAKLESRLSRLDLFEVVTDSDTETHLEWQCDGEHDYRSDPKERIPFIETWSVYITRVNEERLSVQLLKA